MRAHIVEKTGTREENVPVLCYELVVKCVCVDLLSAVRRSVLKLTHLKGITTLRTMFKFCLLYQEVEERTSRRDSQGCASTIILYWNKTL